MDVVTILGILGGIITIGVATVSLARYFARNQRQMDLLRQEIKDLKADERSLRASFREDPSGRSTNIYEKLVEMSTEAARAVKAEIHSVSTVIPIQNPTHIKIVLSSDPEANKVVGREFSIDKGIAGRVYATQKPYILNGPDKYHFEMIDRAAKTQYGRGAILTLPLTIGGRCYGIVQFLKSEGKVFKDDDISIASQWVPALTRLLFDLTTRPNQDIPSIAHGNITTYSILFSDIRNFSAIASKISIGSSVDMLNEYYKRLLPLALANGGMLREYVGDGLYISFSSGSQASSARNAVKSAIEMQKEFSEIVYSWSRYHLPVSEENNSHTIGIATGPLYSGVVGYRDERHEKLIGPTVNLASHLCEAAKEVGGIVVCNKTIEYIKTDQFTFKPVQLSIGKYNQILVDSA